MKRILPLVVAALFVLVALFCMVGCAGAPIGVEICVMHPEYGKICGTLKDGQVTITADVDLPPDVYAKIEDQIRRLGGN